jgi:vacuolar iron transporter family protein
VAADQTRPLAIPERGTPSRGPLTVPIDATVADGSSDAVELRRKTQQVAKGAARAAVLGVNDGLVSNLLIILGVAGANAAASSVRLAGFASLLAGAISMAAGEWISVRSQVELYGGVLDELRTLIRRNPKLVLGELVGKLVDAGLEPSTAQRVSTELPLDGDKFMTFTARTVFGLDPEELGSPVTAAVSSLGLFAAGALVPLFPWFFVHGGRAVALSIVLTALASAGVGVVVARSSGGSAGRSAARQLAIVVGVAAITYLIGKVLGTAVG